MNRSLLLPGLLASAVLLAGSARAHGIQSSLERFGDLRAQLESSFSSGQPAGLAAVRLVRPDGQAIELGQTDAHGRLNFRLQAQVSSDWELQVDAGPGHRDYLELPAAAGPEDAARSSSLPGAAGWRSRLLGFGALGCAGLLGGLLLRRDRA